MKLDPSEPLLSAEEIDAFFGQPLPAPDALDAETASAILGSDHVDADEAEVAADAVSAEPQRPGWLKNQVADLADLVLSLIHI